MRGLYRVPSQSVAGAFYGVSFGESGWSCTCRYHLAGSRRCKHIRAVAGLVMKERKVIDEERSAVVIDGGSAVTCRFCRSPDCRWRERRTNRRGTTDRYWCARCGRRFTHDPGFVGRHYPLHVITEAVGRCAAGESPARAAEGMDEKGVAVSRQTVQRWVDDYGTLVWGASEKLSSRAGYTWLVDEIHLRSKGEPMWAFGVMDAETGWVIAYETSDKKFGYDASALFGKAVKNAGRRPDVLVSDALPGFKTGYRSAMYTNTTPRTIHTADAGIAERHLATSKIYERFNGEIRDRTARVRGFNSDDPLLIRLLLAYHNFIRPHGGLGGKTPAEAAGIIIRGPGKWIRLIRYAASCA